MDVDALAAMLDLPGLTDDLARFEERLLAATSESNRAIREPALRVVKGGGKRLRPILTIASAAAVGSKATDEVLMAAVAVEMVHVGSLVHDDIIDHAATRRGVATVNSVEGIDTAILVGDFLLSRAGKESARISQATALTLADAIIDLCVGQSLETSALHDVDRTEADMLEAIGGKTGALLRAACAMGGQAAGATDAAVEALTSFGYAFGLAFQLVDDVLDLTSTNEKMGKPVGNDIREGNYSLPVIRALAHDTEGSLRSLLVAGEADAAADLVRGSVGLLETMARATALNSEAAAAVSTLPSGTVATGLGRLPSEYARWAVERSVAEEHLHLMGEVLAKVG